MDYSRDQYMDSSADCGMFVMTLESRIGLMESAD